MTPEQRVNSVIDRYAKHHPDSPGQRDLFTGDVRKSPKSQSKLKWITLHDVHGNGTTHVQISESGDIKAGPAALKGRNLHDLKNKTHHESRSHDPNLEYTPDGRPVGPTVRSIDDLNVDAKRFQYKITGINPETGTNSELKENKLYDPELGGQLLIWKDPENGKDFVINGHHRYELAKKSPRSTEVGKFKGSVPVYYVNAKDHVEARAHGALANIAEGRGSATDAAKFMRDMGVGLEDFEKRGISTKGAIANAALDLKKLSPTLFQKLTNGLLSEGRATAIGKHLPNEDAQDQLFHWISKHEKENAPFSDRKVAEMARVTAAIKPKVEKGGMFDDFFASYPIEQRADIMGHISRSLSGEAKSLKDASSRRRAGIIEAEGDNRIDVVGNKDRAKTAELISDEFSARANASGHPIAKMLDDAAFRLSQSPRHRKTIYNDALDFVRSELARKDATVLMDQSSPRNSSVADIASKYSRLERVLQRIAFRSLCR